MTGLAGEPVAYFLRKVIILICCGLFNVVILNPNTHSSLRLISQHNQKGDVILTCLLIVILT